MNSQHFKEKSPLIIITLTFIGVYLILFILYQTVLLLSHPDFFSILTVRAVNGLFHLTGFPTTWQVMGAQGDHLAVFLDDRWIVNIVEGCNGMSIIILFIAFVWALPGGWTEKLRFSVAGVALIWVINVVRIWILGLIYAYRPQWFDLMHRVIFPGMLYGTVILLWIYWARRVKRRWQG